MPATTSTQQHGQLMKILMPPPFWERLENRLAKPPMSGW
jgi:hypothetical protein